MTTPSDAPQRETERSGTLRVLIVDDEPLARRRLRALLSAHEDIAIVGDAEDVLGAVRGARALSPDVLLLDVRIPGGDGFDVARRLLARGAEGLEVSPFISVRDRRSHGSRAGVRCGGGGLSAQAVRCGASGSRA